MSIVQLLINAAKGVGSVVSIIYNDFLEERKLTTSDRQANDQFGYSVAMSDDGTRCIVSTRLESGGPGDPILNAGAAYVFSRSGGAWTEEQKLTASDAQASDLFGWAVSMSGDGTRCVVTARDEDGGAGDPISAAGAAYVFSRSGTTWTEEQILRASDAKVDGYLGYGVAISDDGSRCIISGQSAGAGTNRGAAYVFSRSGTTWTEEQKLTASDAADGDLFGRSAAISDDGSRCIVGAYSEDGGSGDPISGAGAAYVFSRSGTTWTEEQILRASDAQANDNFGYDVSISDDGSRCIVGAYQEDGGSGNPISGAGAAYVFSRSGTTWTEEQILRASDAQANDYFGWSVSISDDGSRSIISAYLEDGGAGDPLSGAGAAYVFSRSGTTWTEEQKLTASDTQNDDQFGYDVAMSGDGSRAIVSAYFEDDGAGDPISNAGAAYVFDTSYIFAEEQQLTASDGQTNDFFGQSVSITGDGSRAIVGAYVEDGGAGDPISGAGAAYVFSRSGTTWTEEQILRASDAQDNDQFGRSIAMSEDGTRCIVGASSEDGAGSNRGAAYVFSRSGTTWTEEQKLTASDAADGDFFGIAVSISDDGSRIVVGAQSHGTGGAAYVFSRSGTTWTEEQKLTASDAETGDVFGVSVSITGDGSRAIVGANGEDGSGGDNRGAAYVYSRSGTTWTQEQKLTASDTQNDDLFGNSVWMSSNGTRCVVGAYQEDGGAGDPTSNSGAAYVFSRSGTTWTEEQILRASDAQANDKFGSSVAISGDGTKCIVGASDEDEAAGTAGAVYVYSRSGTTWTQEQKSTSSGAINNGQLGISVAIAEDGTRAIFGEIQVTNNGAAYVFSTS